ncbi:MAG: GTPase HflX [Clostridia bacterium]|nr:GTPase HflX [Clostridia bacterium]
MNYTENVIVPERTLLVALDTGEYDVESSLDELWELTKSSGAEPVATLTQKRPSPETATCVGSGMVQEIREFCENNQIELIIFDRELTPTQIRNLEHDTDVRVVDRTMLILDIFAQRAQSKAGKVQVEVAQLKYLLPRLSGKGAALSRLGGGIGTRGPGETKLETDRRHIRRRIEALREQLKKVETGRQEIQRRRKKDGTVTVALVGYTNAGKSTLMNLLTEAGVLAENKLFATLDPTARALKLPGGKTVMLIDTVGLVRRLPHHLVEAFKSTLEQAATADILLNVCDASSPEARVHLDVTNEILQSLGCGERPVIPVLNKWDLVELPDEAVHVPGAVRISALKNEGIDVLLQAIEDNLPVKAVEVAALLPFSKTGIAAQLRQAGALLSEEYTAEGLMIRAKVEPKELALLEPYLTEDTDGAETELPQDKIQAFLQNAQLLQALFEITPLLYGSLGLEYLTGDDLNAEDIDILIPKTHLQEGWAEFRTMLEEDGYVLVDEHEHTFEKDGIQYSYAQIEELESFAGIPMAEIETTEKDGVPFQLLSLEQYLQVYMASSKDGYRVHTRNKKDAEKIALIEEWLSL